MNQDTKKKNYFPDPKDTAHKVIIQRSPEEIQEDLLERACKHVVRAVNDAIQYGQREITVSTWSGMTMETKRRFWTDLESRVGAESLSLFNGMVMQSNPPQDVHEPWSVEGALYAQYAFLKI